MSNVDISFSTYHLKCDFTVKSLRNSILLFWNTINYLFKLFFSYYCYKICNTQYDTTLRRPYSISLPSLRSDQDFKKSSDQSVFFQKDLFDEVIDMNFFILLSITPKIVYYY